MPKPEKLNPEELVQSLFDETQNDLDEPSNEVIVNDNDIEEDDADDLLPDTPLSDTEDNDLESKSEGKSEENNDQSEDIDSKKEPTLDQLNKEKEILEKRRSDTQKSWDKERNAREKAEKELRELKSDLEEKKLEKTKLNLESLKQKLVDGDNDGVVDAFAAIEQKFTSLESMIKNINGVDPLMIEEAVVAANHDDANEVLKFFAKQADSDSEIMDEWVSQGRKAKAAYKIGKRLLDAKEIMKNPEAYKQKIIDEYENKQSKTKKVSTLSEINSQGKPPSKSKNKNVDLGQVDLVDSIFV